MMNRTAWLEDLQKNVSDLIARSPAADVQRNVRAFMAQGFSKMDLATRTRARVDQLTAQVEQLESRLSALEK
jgi:BMFP domain-containing protein YqiC